MSEPAELGQRIAHAVRDAGGRALVVGGWVRDRLMGHPSKDVDIEVYGIEPEPLKTLLGRFGAVNTVGESFTVYKVGDIDVSIPRTESKTGRGHKGFTVRGDPSLTPAQATRRRDFTINAIAWDPLTGDYIDPFDGRRARSSSFSISPQIRSDGRSSSGSDAHRPFVDSSTANSNRAANWTARSTRRLSSAKVAASTARRRRRSRSARPSNGSM